MAIKTGEIFNSLVFGGVNSADYGIYITGEGVFNAPKRAVNMVAVPGRNGSIAIDQGHWENIEVTYPAGTFGMDEQEFRTALSNFRNAIASQVGYQRLTDTYHPDEYRMALYSEGLEVEPTTYNKAGEFELKFNCKPQRWLTSGEVPVTIGEWGATKTASGEIVTIESEGGEAAKSLEVSLEPIQDLNGYDKPWVGGAGKNKLPPYATTQTKNGITFTVNSDGTIKANGTATATTVLHLSTFGDLWSSGSYILNGCPSGGGNNKYCLRLYATGGITLVSDFGSGVTFTGQTQLECAIVIWNGQTVSNIVFKPMIRLASVSDATYEPYENICPVSGWTSVTTKRTNRNCLPANGLDSVTTNGITFTKNADGSITANGTATAVTLYWILGANNILKLPNGRYTLNGCPSGGSNSTYRISSYTPNGNGFAHDYGGGASFDYLAEGVKFGIVVYAGATLNNVTFKPMLRLASDTDDTYEPYNGQTYTTALGRTVYGGTLDVVSGVLTVDRAMFNARDKTWSYGGGGVYVYTNIADTDRTQKTEIQSNVFPYWSGSEVADGYASWGGSPNNGNLIVWSSVVTNTLAEWNAYIADNDVTFVYYLATPQTYQLTPQEVTLLVGENHVWSDGAITMQYGDDPNSLYNPTQYDAGPLLAIEGNGTVQLGQSRLDVSDGILGTYVVAENHQFVTTVRYWGSSLEIGPYFNSGDKFSLGKVEVTELIEDKNGNIFTEVSNISLSEGTSVSFEGNTLRIRTVFDYGEFTVGSGYTNRSREISFDVKNSSGKIDTATFGIGFTYSNLGDLFVSGYITSVVPASGSTGFDFSANYLYSSVVAKKISGFSTLSVGSLTKYVDCETGESYVMLGDRIISNNRNISLPVDLPVLTSGANAISFSNTITDLKITPRWWKL